MALGALDPVEPYRIEVEFKVAVVGGPGCGKSSLLRRYGSNAFSDLSPTICFDVQAHVLPDFRPRAPLSPVPPMSITLTLYDVSHAELEGTASLSVHFADVGIVGQHKDLIFDGVDGRQMIFSRVAVSLCSRSFVVLSPSICSSLFRVRLLSFLACPPVILTILMRLP